jgi:hypothetical protein
VIDRHSLRRTAVASLLIQGVAALCFHGLTLCIGSDGHTGLAWMAADDCCPRTASASIKAGGCCDCTDAPLLQPIAEKRGGSDEIACSALPPMPGKLFIAAAWTSVPAVSGLPPPAGLVSRRSVVLQA